MASLLFFCTIASLCHAQTHGVVCRDGTGNFEAEFRTGVKVQVGAVRSGQLATRVCEATLGWDKRKLTVVSATAELDVDALGIDLDMGVPVVTFQARKSGAECCMSFLVYSLQKPPRLLRTITGGDFFSTADTDLDGQVEIWTHDAASLEGFENLVLGGLDFPPTNILRFVHGRLVDVSSEFQPHFDDEIAKVRADLDPQDLRDFRDSNGRLPPTALFSPEDLRHSENLRRTKVKVLEIIWSYVYSGREEQAWQSLAEMWPAADVDRIRAAILSARARGIRAQVDGVRAGISTEPKKHTTIFDIRTRLAAGPGGENRLGMVPPAPILIERHAPADPSKDGSADSELLLDLVIDSAGKVRSAEAPENKPIDIDLKDAAASWKFIPALRAGRAVASRIYFVISPKR